MKENGTRLDKFSMTYGYMLIQWPDVVTPGDYEDTKKLMKIFLRKLKRQSEKEPIEQVEDSNEREAQEARDE